MAADQRKRGRRGRTVRVRTTLGATAIVGLALLVGGAGLLTVLRGSLVDNVADAGRLRAEDVVTLIQSGVAPEDLAIQGEDDDEEGTFVQVVDERGSVVASSTNVAGQPLIAEVAEDAERRVEDLAHADHPYLVVSETTDRLPAGERLSVVVGRSLEPVDETLGQVLRVLMIGLPLLLVVVAFTTWAVVGRALRPVASIAAEVRAISESKLDRRVPEPRGDDEIARLARTMNAMLARLERARDRQRRFVSDASHELRSPIATIRHQLEVALAHADRADLSTVARDVLDEDLRMQGLVEDLLVLARADEDAVSTERGAVDLDDLALAEARRLRNADRVAVDATGIHPVRVAGDQALLARAVRNLVDNAERHAHGMVRLEVHLEGSTAVLAVVDDGPGVAQEHRQRVFERFTRLDEARSRGQGGSGLGLAIVAQVAAEHHGAVRCSEARGGGARFELRLPAVDMD